MKPIVLAKRLGPLTDSQLRALTKHLAEALEGQHVNADGSYVPFYQEQLNRLRAEWSRRGEQLTLF